MQLHTCCCWAKELLRYSAGKSASLIWAVDGL